MANITADKVNYDELKEYISSVKDIKGPLMPIMQKAQDIFGCLPIEVQDCIAEELDIPMTDIYGVATFYSQFSLEPKGEHVIGVCMGTACYVKNAQPILERLSKELKLKVGKTSEDGKFTLEATRCLGCCGLAPVIMIGDKVFGRLSPDDIPEILEKY
jgi:NADH:ubiquinone oxidoreductase subunit E